jgi:hypothetical protein
MVGSFFGFFQLFGPLGDPWTLRVVTTAWNWGVQRVVRWDEGRWVCCAGIAPAR